MNKFFLTIIKDDSQVITKHDTEDAAMSAFHSGMAYAYNAKVDTTCYVTDKYGSFIQRPTTYKHAEPAENVETGIPE